jgi:hypothetical protein
MAQYRALAQDHRAGRPRRQDGDVGTYWTVPVPVPLSELTGVQATIFNIGRLYRVRMARQKSIMLPPIQLGVSRHGRVWIVDGNHRLSEARESGQPTIMTRFTFSGN